MNIKELAYLSRIPLIGQISRSVIAIAIGYDTHRKVILINFYFDQNKTEVDDEIMLEVGNEIYTAAIDSGYDIADVIVEGVSANGKSYKELNGLDGFLFARKEDRLIRQPLFNR